MSPKINPRKKPRLPKHLKAGNPGNSGGKKGRSGRKTLAFAAACAELTDGIVLSKVQRHLRARGPTDPAWRWCAEYVTGYGKGKPVQPVSGEGGGPVTVRIVRDDPAGVPA